MVKQKPTTLEELKETLLREKGISSSAVDQVIQRPLVKTYAHKKKIQRNHAPKSSLEPDLTVQMKPTGKVVNLVRKYPSATVSVPPDRQEREEEVVMETPPEGRYRTGSGTPEERVPTENRVGLTPTDSCLEDFIADFDSTVVMKRL